MAMSNKLVMNRRRWLHAAGVLTCVSLTSKPSWATPGELHTAIKTAFGETPIQPGRVTLDLPALAENGNSVRLSISVDSPMQKDNDVRVIQLFASQNPLPDIARFELSWRNGRAYVETRIRLAAEQDVVAIAQMSDGSLWSGSAHIVVTEAACLDALI